jgi:acetyl-CoA C-acetyltransferase
VVSTDDGPRAGVTIEGVSALKPVFPAGRHRDRRQLLRAQRRRRSPGGHERQPRRRSSGITPLARIVSTGRDRLSPEIMGYGPVDATTWR